MLDGDSGPIDMNFGIATASGFRHGDIVLNDGAPEGSRTAGNRDYAVFNVRSLLQASTFQTAIARIEVASEADVQSLKAMLTEAGHVMEDWTVNLRSLCKQCSEGKPHEARDAALSPEWQAQRELGVAIGANAATDATNVFARWQDSTGGRLRSFDIVPHHQDAH